MITKSKCRIIFGGFLEILCFLTYAYTVLKTCLLGYEQAVLRGANEIGKSVFWVAVIGTLVFSVIWYYIFGWRGYVIRKLPYIPKRFDCLRRYLLLFIAALYNRWVAEIISEASSKLPDAPGAWYFVVLVLFNLVVFSVWGSLWEASHKEQQKKTKTIKV